MTAKRKQHTRTKKRNTAKRSTKSRVRSPDPIFDVYGVYDKYGTRHGTVTAIGIRSATKKAFTKMSKKYGFKTLRDFNRESVVLTEHDARNYDFMDG